MNYRWFKHDYKARADAKLIDLMMRMGLEGIGAFWCVVEMLYENNGLMQTDCERIAYELHCKSEIIKYLIYDSGLFEYDENFFFSNSINERLKIKNEKSKKAVKAASIRWKQPHANAMQTQCKRNPNKEKIREDNIREENIIKEKVEKEKTDEPVFYYFLNKKSKVPILETDLKRWKEIYPNTDIEYEIKKAQTYVIDNPQKNYKQIKSFINNWLARNERDAKPKEPQLAEYLKLPEAYDAVQPF